VLLVYRLFRRIMARGKFNKRGGGPRLDAVNEQEIELRNARLEAFEEQRTQRRADEESDEEEGEGDKKKTKGKTEASASDADAVPKKEKAVEAGPPAPPAPVTTEYDHRRNMAKLAQVRKRREVAEARRLLEEEYQKKEEEELRQQAAAATEEREDDDKKSKKKAGKTIPKLDKIAIKKMKPAQMKEALKERGLEIQGNAKELLDRLLIYESSR
jgi:hypothetical protein